MDVVDRLPCIDVVCAHGGHEGCRPNGPMSLRELSQRLDWPEPGPELLPVGSDAWWQATVERMKRRSHEHRVA